MILTNKKILLAVFLVSSFYSCKTKKKAVKKEPVTQENVIIPVSELYARSCGNCHDLPSPMAHDSTAWKGILKDMQKRAHLTDNNISDIYSYLMEEQKKASVTD